MSHMQPEVREGDYFQVDTTEGIEIVPCEAVGRTMTTHVEALLNYLDGRPDDPDQMCEVKHGWLARLSAPGYMDCTCWSAHDTEQEAREYIDEVFGD